MEQITSRENARVKDYIKLSKSGRYRDECGLFVIEGVKLLCEALANSVELKTIFITEGTALPSDIDIKGIETFEIKPEVAAKMSTLKSSSEVLCVCVAIDKKLYTDKIIMGSRVIIVDTVQNPGNIGTIVRTATAFGFDGVLLSEDSASPWSPKVLRGAMGGLFKIPVTRCNLVKTIAVLKDNSFLVVGTMLSEGTVDITDIESTDKMAFVIGNEGAGISEQVAATCDKAAIIPISDSCESLNAAVAASIVMWQFRK